MPLGSASDVLSMLRDAGEVAVYNGVSSYGIVEMADVLEGSDSGGMMQNRQTTLLIATDAFTDLRVGGRIVAGDRPFRIDGPPMLEDDGALTRLTVARTS